MIRYENVLIAVSNIEISKKFYKEIFEQEVLMDLGKNVMLSGGFCLQEDFDWLLGIDKDTIKKKSHNMELYFEVDDFEAFVNKLKQFQVEYVHEPKQYEWKQRVVRIYDPDQHMIEIGESMAVIAKRYLKQGHSAEETAEIIQHPIAFVLECQKDI